MAGGCGRVAGEGDGTTGEGAVCRSRVPCTCAGGAWSASGGTREPGTWGRGPRARRVAIVDGVARPAEGGGFWSTLLIARAPGCPLRCSPTAASPGSRRRHGGCLVGEAWGWTAGKEGRKSRHRQARAVMRLGAKQARGWGQGGAWRVRERGGGGERRQQDDPCPRSTADGPRGCASWPCCLLVPARCCLGDAAVPAGTAGAARRAWLCMVRLPVQPPLPTPLLGPGRVG
jgi:hypothetical protein